MKTSKTILRPDKKESHNQKELRKEIIEITKKLAGYRTTVSRPDEIRRCIDYIREYFSETSCIITEENVREKPMLFISLNRRKKQRLILNGHIDVVDGFDSQFFPELQGDKIVGRGTYDMKSSVAVMMVLMKELSVSKKRHSVGLMIVSDEETEGECTKAMVRKGYRADLVIIGEPTRLMLETKHKGMMQLKMFAYGSASHGSRPWQGKNAILKLWHQYERFTKELPLATRSKKWNPSVNVTSFMAESAFNITPKKAELVLDVRTTEDYPSAKIINILKRLKIKHSIVVKRNMLFNKKKGPVQLLKKSIEKELGRRLRFVKSCGGSDAPYFTAKGVPAVNFGPIGRGHHKGTEYVNVSSLISYHDILVDFVKEQEKEHHRKLKKAKKTGNKKNKQKKGILIKNKKQIKQTK